MKATKLGQSIIQGLKDVIEHEKGNKKLKTSFLEIPAPAPHWSKKQISEIRKKSFGVSQPIFAAMLGVTPSTIKAWEQGLKNPSGVACRLIQILSLKPDILKILVQAGR